MGPMPSPFSVISFIFALCAVSYLIGSLPFGLILTKLAGYGDIRKIGSGNIGATNVLRTGNKKLAALTVFLDAVKGALPVMVCFSFRLFDLAFFTSMAAILGHMFPIWLKFKGGKGVATSFGAVLLLCWPVGILGFATWLIVFFCTRLSSLSAICASIVIPAGSLALFFLTSDREDLLFRYYDFAIISFLVIVKHHSNIRRLLNGTEPRVSFGSKK